MSNNTEIEALIPILVEIGPQILGVKYVDIFAYSLFVYDTLLTLDDEIIYIWRRKFTFVTFLYIMNRYYALAAAAVVLAGVFSTLFTPEVNVICSRLVPFDTYAFGVPLTIFPSMVTGLRVYALYERKTWIGAFLTIFLIGEFGVAMWIYSTPGAHPLELPGPPSLQDSITLHVCIQQTADKLGNARSAVFIFMQTVYDTIVFILLAFKTLTEFEAARRADSVMNLLAAHGIIYYAVIFTCNFTWAMMILFAPTGLKYVAGGPTVILDSALVCRMTLALRRFGAQKDVVTSRKTKDNLAMPTPTSAKMVFRTHTAFTDSFPIWSVDRTEETETSGTYELSDMTSSS